jgi:ATP-binding cassette, subfamily A (ABC1), member 3
MVAVDDLSVKIYNDNIFVLLGHNGAGKTTTISMLTGMLEPTAGKIEVMGETDLRKIR